MSRLNITRNVNAAPPYYFLYKYLRNAAGATNMNKDFSGSPTEGPFYYEVPAGHDAVIARMTVVIIDGGVDPSDFGGISALTTGMTLKCVSATGSTLIDFTNGENIKANSDWRLLTGDEVISTAVAGDDQLSVNINFAATGVDLLLHAGQRIEIDGTESLTAITSFRAMVHGLETST